MSNEIKTNREFKILTDVQHVLMRVEMYLGSRNLTSKEQWIYDKASGKFHYGTVKYVPALLKCASELVDNSIDVAIDTNFKAATRIKINVDAHSIEVIDDGIGIPCVPPKGNSSIDPGQTCACLAWTTLKSGTSFNDNRKKIGTNGVGSSCVNVFSRLFIGKSDDGEHSQTITCTNNLSHIDAGKVKKSSGKAGCDVYCEPDLDRFGLKEIDQTHIDLIYQRIVNLSICYPQIKFIFNNEKVNVNEKKFAQMFSENAEIDSSENAIVCVFPNEYDDFKFYSCVNGIDTIRGGSHVDYALNEIASRMRDKLVKKYKSIRPGDIKNKLCLVVFMTGFSNPQFDSQTKESLSNANSDIVSHFAGKIDFDSFTKKLLKNDAITEPIIETFKIKEEFKARQELKGVSRCKVRSDKYMPPIGEKKFLALCEGLSARGGISMCLGRQGIGYYAMRGLPLNAYVSSVQKIVTNQELKDIVNILNLDISKDNPVKSITFDKILITTDNDADGSHITSMLIGWFKKFAPNLFNEGRICKLITPLIIIEDKDGNVQEYFFDVNSYKSWQSKHKIGAGCKIRYLKGLGSWQHEQLVTLISKAGLNSFIQEYKLDKDSNAYIENWLGNDAEPRKKYLRSYSFDINKA
jgi:DNA topoisomerase-2